MSAGVTVLRTVRLIVGIGACFVGLRLLWDLPYWADAKAHSIATDYRAVPPEWLIASFHLLAWIGMAAVTWMGWRFVKAEVARGRVVE